MTFFDSLYTLQDIGIYYNFSEEDLIKLTKMSEKKKLSNISKEFPRLKKFIPYCEEYIYKGKNVYAIPAKIYDTYIQTGFFIDIGVYDKQPNTEKKEYWKYNPSPFLNIDLENGWDFAKDILNCDKSEDIWKIFMSGSARMDYYQDEKVDIQQRIKYAIVEYMLKRPQFFTTDDFIDNPILHKKYSKK